MHDDVTLLQIKACIVESPEWGPRREQDRSGSRYADDSYIQPVSDGSGSGSAPSVFSRFDSLPNPVNAVTRQHSYQESLSSNQSSSSGHTQNSNRKDPMAVIDGVSPNDVKNMASIQNQNEPNDTQIGYI